jgi:tRNA A22 N-methylase
LKNGLSQKVIFSDVSKGSLAKAEKLLGEFVIKGYAKGVLGDGFYGIPADTEQVLIAGMGGSEIVGILSDKKYGFMPKRFVFQPMHDGEKLRRYLIENGGDIERDFTFEDGKFYEVIVGGKLEDGGQVRVYSEAEYEFGKENLEKMPQAFVRRTEKQLKNTDKYLQIPNLQENSRMALEGKKKRLQGVLSGEIK